MILKTSEWFPVKDNKVITFELSSKQVAANMIDPIYIEAYSMINPYQYRCELEAEDNAIVMRIRNKAKHIADEFFPEENPWVALALIKGHKDIGEATFDEDVARKALESVKYGRIQTDDVKKIIFDTSNPEYVRKLLEPEGLVNIVRSVTTTFIEFRNLDENAIEYLSVPTLNPEGGDDLSHENSWNRIPDYRANRDLEADSIFDLENLTSDTYSYLINILQQVEIIDYRNELIDEKDSFEDVDTYDLVEESLREIEIEKREKE